MKRVLILYNNAGHGHRKVGEAIRDEVNRVGSGQVDVTIFDALEKTNPLFKWFYPAIYFFAVRWMPQLWGFFFNLTDNDSFYKFIRPLRTLWNKLQSFPLQKYLIRENYDTIIFTHFFAAEVAASLKKAGKLKSTLITSVTDVMPHWVWTNKGTDFYWVMAEESRQVLLGRGCDRSNIITGGIPIHDTFLARFDRLGLQKKYSLQENTFTVLFTSGSFALGPTKFMLDELSKISESIQCIVICGNNKKLFNSLQNRTFSYPVHVVGFTDEMPEYMAISDVIVAKPGGATTCESLAMGLPMIITGAIPGQEFGNKKWLLARTAAFALEHPAKIGKIIQDMVNFPDILKHALREMLVLAKPHAARDLADFILFNQRKNFSDSESN